MTDLDETQPGESPALQATLAAARRATPAWNTSRQQEALWSLSARLGAPGTRLRLRPLLALGVALLGAFLVGGVGFSHIMAVHNAAHDYRHSMGFPCH